MVTTQEYPPLTDEMLEDIEDRIIVEKPTAEDCRLINHYLASVGLPDYLKDSLAEVNVGSFAQAERILKRGRYDLDDMLYPSVIGTIEGCFYCLLDQLEESKKAT